MKQIFLLFLLFVFLPLAAVQTVEQHTFIYSEQCPAGGVEVVIGEDADSNGLDDDEITSRVSICKGEDGCDVVAVVGNPAASAQCPKNLSVTITSGVDCNSDTLIDTGKATSTVICFGQNGSDGAASAEVGSTVKGDDGKAGKTSDVIVSEEPAGDNCAAGGSKIETRFDKNGNGIFEESEISVNYVCNGENPQGSKGEQGRQGIAGNDGKDGADGAKGERGDKGEQGEQGIAGEQGETGSDGFDALVSMVDEAAGDNCENGGTKFMSGLDKDRNGVLDENEVQNSYYICNGEDAVEASEQALSSGCSLTIF